MTALLVRYLGRISYCSALSLQTELVTKYKLQDQYYVSYNMTGVLRTI